MKTAILLRSPRDEENIISPRVARVPRNLVVGCLPD